MSDEYRRVAIDEIICKHTIIVIYEAKLSFYSSDAYCIFQSGMFKFFYFFFVT